MVFHFGGMFALAVCLIQITSHRPGIRVRDILLIILKKKTIQFNHSFLSCVAKVQSTTRVFGWSTLLVRGSFLQLHPSTPFVLCGKDILLLIVSQLCIRSICLGAYLQRPERRYTMRVYLFVSWIPLGICTRRSWV